MSKKLAPLTLPLARIASPTPNPKQQEQGSSCVSGAAEGGAPIRTRGDLKGS